MSKCKSVHKLIIANYNYSELNLCIIVENSYFETHKALNIVVSSGEPRPSTKQDTGMLFDYKYTIILYS